MELIPTRLKDKLPKGFTYPVGAEKISEALTGTKQYSEFELWFRWKDCYFHSDYKEKLINRGDISILVVSFSDRNLSYFSNWRIQIYAVPSEYSQSVKSQLNEELFNNLLLSLHGVPSNASCFRWSAIYNIKNESIRVSA